jgi:hypothetical protein
MNLHLRSLPWAGLKGRIRGMFNLNDPRWGRGDEKQSESNKPDPQKPEGNGRGPNQGPPDLDELWRDFNRKLGGLFGGKGRRPDNGGGFGGGGNFHPDMKSAGVGAGLVLLVVFVIWMGTGIFIVQEGQQAVITRFGRYHSTLGAGFNYRLPYPIERHETVYVTQIRSVDVGRDTVIKATGLRESAMLTEDENIVEIKFAVQYRLNDARAYLFESKNPSDAVVQAAETAVREVVGKMRMDSALAEERDQIGPRVRALMQTMLDRYKVGIEVVGLRRCAQGRPGARAGQERGPGLRQRCGAAGGGLGLAPDAGGRRVQVQDRGPGAGRCAALQVDPRRVPARPAGHTRSHVPGDHAADLQQRHQGPGGVSPGQQPAVPAARQDPAAGGRGTRAIAGHFLRHHRRLSRA